MTAEGGRWPGSLSLRQGLPSVTPEEKRQAERPGVRKQKLRPVSVRDQAPERIQAAGLAPVVAWALVACWILAEGPAAAFTGWPVICVLARFLPHETIDTRPRIRKTPGFSAGSAFENDTATIMTIANHFTERARRIPARMLYPAGHDSHIVLVDPHRRYAAPHSSPVPDGIDHIGNTQ